MEIRSQQKGHHVIKILFFLAISILCNNYLFAQEIEPEEKHTIINKEIELLTGKPSDITMLLEQKLADSFMFRWSEIIYNKSNIDYYMSEKELYKFFNKNEVAFFKEQFIKQEEVKTQFINRKNIKIINSLQKPLKQEYILKVFIELSKPVYSIDKNFIFIAYFRGGISRDFGESGLHIYEKKDGEWVMFKHLQWGII